MRDKGLRIGLGILRTVIIAAGAILLVLIANKSGTEESYKEGMARYGTELDLVFGLTTVAWIICAAAAILFGIGFFVANIKERMSSLLGIVGFVALGLISFYVLADGTVLRAYEVSGIDVSENESLFAGGGLYFVYLLGAGAIIAIIWAEISRLVK